VKLRRVVVFSLAALLLATGLWVVGGNAWTARLEMAHYSDVIRTEFARSMKAPLSDHYPEPSTKGGWGLASVFSSISIPNIQSSFVRADRLVVDAELTSPYGQGGIKPLPLRFSSN